jgi:hypothetical protein
MGMHIHIVIELLLTTYSRIHTQMAMTKETLACMLNKKVAKKSNAYTIERVVLLESAHARNYSPAWCGRSRSRTESVRGAGAGAGLRWWRIREVNSRWWQRLYSASVMNAREFNLQQLARGLPLRRTNQVLQLLRLSGRYLVAETRAFLVTVAKQ